jgi:HlyD family secretion protein
VELTFDVNRLPVTEVLVVSGQEVKKGDVLVKIDPSSLERAVEQAEVNVLSAEEALEKAKEPYTALELQKARLDVASAEVALARVKEETVDDVIRGAEQTLADARAQLAALESDTTSTDQIERLQWQANVAEVEHGKLLEGPITTEEGRDREVLAYNRMMDARDALETAEARAALNLLNAQDKVREAEQNLAALKAGGSELAAAAVQNMVAQAEYNLARAQDTLSTMNAGADPKTVQMAQASYDSARASLEEARATLESATMVAPFDGTVTSVGVAVGDLVSSGTRVVTLADLGKLEVVATVDETEISQVKVGQNATITFDALSGAKFTGKVVEVPLVGQLVQNVVSYDVVLSLEGAGGESLLPGMTANVTIVTGQRQNVLLLPALAIAQDDSGDVVTLEGSEGTVPVQVGLSNGTYVEVVRGLNEGDKVVIAYSASSSDQQLFFRGEGMGTTIMGGSIRRGQ